MTPSPLSQWVSFTHDSDADPKPNAWVLHRENIELARHRDPTTNESVY